MLMISEFDIKRCENVADRLPVFVRKLILHFESKGQCRDI